MCFSQNQRENNPRVGYWTREHSSQCSSDSAVVFTPRYISHARLVEMQFVASAGSYGAFGVWIVMNSALFKKKKPESKDPHTHSHTHSGTELLLLSLGCVKTFSIPHTNHGLKGPVPKSLLNNNYQKVLNLITSRFQQERSPAPNSFPLLIIYFSLSCCNSLWISMDATADMTLNKENRKHLSFIICISVSSDSQRCLF